MDIDVNDKITLSDDISYLVVGKTIYDNKTYFFLVDFNNYANIKCCYENSLNHSVIVVDDKKLIQKLLPKFIDSQNKAYIDSLVESMDEN